MGWEDLNLETTFRQVNPIVKFELNASQKIARSGTVDESNQRLVSKLTSACPRWFHWRSDLLAH